MPLVPCSCGRRVPDHNHIGHTDFVGCFRCHDETHTSAAGRTLSQDCDSCHTILAQDEKDPKILADLGIGGSP